MKLFFAFILLFSAGFSLFQDPPIENMTRLNMIQVPGLQNIFLSQLPQSLPSHTNPIIAADARLVKLDPSVDNSISTDKMPGIIWVWAEKHKDTILDQVMNPQGCTDTYILNFINSTRKTSITASFKNISRSISNPALFFIELPFSSYELNNTGPYENISITLTGQFEFFYDRTISIYSKSCTQGVDGKGQHIQVCVCVPSSIVSDTADFKKPFFSQLNYVVEGRNVLFFLVAPVLLEQWYKNNRFDNIAFSNRKFYKSAVIFNDTEIANLSLYNFDLYNDNLGIWYIKTLGITNNTNVSFNNSSSFSENQVFINPYAIEEINDSFSYLYQINSTYPGLGKNNLSIIVFDRFLNSFAKSQLLTSRALSLNGKVQETGEPVTVSSFVRPALPYKQEKLRSIIINLGFIGVFLFIVFRLIIR